VNLDEALKEGIVYFKEGKLHDVASDLPLLTNFGKGGMKRLMEEKMGKSNALQARETETYAIEVKRETSPSLPMEMYKIGAQAIRNATEWEDPVDAISIRAFLDEEQNNDEQQEAFVEEKRGRAAVDDVEDEPAQKKRPQGSKEATEEQRPAKLAFVHPGDGPLPKDKWEERVNNQKGKEKEESRKGKGKGPAYKLQSDIESSIDMKGVLEERILDAKIEFILREALGIAKKDFHELIIDVIKRKKQMTAETVMVQALDTHMTKDEEFEIGEVFALICKPVAAREKAIDGNTKACEGQMVEEEDDYLTNEEEDEILLMFAQICAITKRSDIAKDEHSMECEEMVGDESEGVRGLKREAHSSQTQEEGERRVDGIESKTTHENDVEVEVKTFECAIVHGFERENEEVMDYFQPFWARATTETRVRLGGLDESVLALVDHESDINIVSQKINEKAKWPIDTNHGWVMRAANCGRALLFGACPAIPTKIGDVEVEQNFFVQNYGAYPVILGQPYITASRMETKVLDDGSHYARIRSGDGKKSVQFLTVKFDNERHRVHLRDGPLPTSLNFMDF
jgi:hypothetical protein